MKFNKKTKYILSFTAVFITGMVVGFFSSDLYMKKRYDSRIKNAPFHITKRIIRELNLPKEKNEQITPIFREYFDYIHSEGDNFRRIIESKREALNKEVESLLSEQEYQEYLKLSEKYFKLRKRFMKHPKKHKHRKIRKKLIHKEKGPIKEKREIHKN